MSTQYMFRVDPCSVELQLEKNPVGPNIWEDKNQPSNLITGTRIIDNSNADHLIGHSAPPDNAPIVTLPGATWASNVGDSG
jgi:hypothetical protein